MHLHQNLYITSTNQKARELKTSPNVKPFDKVITLDALILECFEKEHLEYIIDETLGISIIYKIIQDQNISYFSYLQNDAASLATIFDFILKCNRNDVAFNQLIENEKHDALALIDKHYQAFKQLNTLVDLADIEKSVAKNFTSSLLNAYQEIYLDTFVVGDICFIKSKQQEKILQSLSQAKPMQPHSAPSISSKLITLNHEVFDSMDEVRSAIKLARKLLEEGAKAEDILMVASDITEYAPLYKLFLPEYGMKGFTSVGTPLSHFSHTKNETPQKALHGYNQHIASLNTLYRRLGLTLHEGIKEQIKANTVIADERIGIEMTEPNQLVGLNKPYKHIIFMGTDINHFPPASIDNFLYRYEDNLTYFYANNYFTSSKTQLDELKRLSQNLYIITASYSGKRELSRSILIGNYFDETVDISSIKSMHEMALQQETLTPTTEQKAYYESLTCKELTPYDGEGVSDICVTHLSASQINKYLSCPLAYLYSNKIKLKAPKSMEDGFDAAEQGSLMHLCFELFGTHIKETKCTSTDEATLYDLMYQKSLEAFLHEETKEHMGEPNIHHEIFVSNVQAGLKDNRDKGLLAKFVDYYIKHANEFEFFQNSEFEKEFALDKELQPYTLTCKEDKNYFIKGFIDRFDNVAEHINIIDYKSKKMSSVIDKDKQADVESLKDVQLALYILYASQHYPNKEYKAHLLSFKGDNPYYHFANLSTIQDLKDTVHFSQEYNERLKKRIYETKENIEAGSFGFKNEDETTCGYCDFRFMCHESVLDKNTPSEKKDS